MRREDVMVKTLRALLIVVALVAAPALEGCSSNRGQRQVVQPVDPRPPAQARVAVPIEEERPWYENAGEVAVIVVGAIVLIGGIVLPIILVSNN
jgi:hypothetical protein